MALRSGPPRTKSTTTTTTKYLNFGERPAALPCLNSTQRRQYRFRRHALGRAGRRTEHGVLHRQQLRPTATPLTITIEGSNDPNAGSDNEAGSNFTLLYSGRAGMRCRPRTSIRRSDWSRFANNTAYVSYRVLVTANPAADTSAPNTPKPC